MHCLANAVLRHVQVYEGAPQAWKEARLVILT